MFPILGLILQFALIGLSLYLARRWQLLGKMPNLASKSFWETIGLGFLAMSLVKFLAALVLFIEQGGEPTTANQLALESLPLPLYFTVFSAAIAAPILEEFVFRGLLMGKVFSPKSYWGLLISSLLFGLAHGPTDVGSWLMYAGTGFVLGWLYRKTDRLDYCMVLHFINNGLAMLLLIVATLFGLT